MSRNHGAPSIQSWPNIPSSTTYGPLSTDDRPQETTIPRKPVPSQVVRESTQPPSTKPRKKKLPLPLPRRLFPSILETTRCWIPELLASLLSVIALLAIVIVLKIYDGRPVDDVGLPRYLTLNGLIAAISTFDRVFLVIPVGSALSQEAWLWFAKNNDMARPKSRLRDLDRSDSASRGAWGSFMFICTSPHRYISIVGAILTLLSLAISTFTQQLIVFKNIPLQDYHSSLQPGNLARTEYWRTYQGRPVQGTLQPGLNMTAAVYSGLMASKVDSPQAYCPSGNCTWPVTPSLAVCGDCAPITPNHTSCDLASCNFTMPSGSVFQLANFTSADAYRINVGFQTMYSNGQHWNASVKDRLYLARFDMMGAPYNYGSQYARFGNMMNASECALWMCVNYYETSVRSGNQTDRIVSSFHDTETPATGTLDNYTMRVQNISEPGSCTNFSVDNFAGLALMGLFSSLSNPVRGIPLNGTVNLTTNLQLASSDATDAMWAGSGDPSEWIQRVATSMSNIIRSTNSMPRSNFNGTAYVQGITIEWWWLTLPVLTVVGSILFLFTVMFRTARSPVEPWRSSPLTLLLFEIDEDIKRAATETMSGKPIGQSTSRRKVTLNKIDGGFWIFKSRFPGIGVESARRGDGDD